MEQPEDHMRRALVVGALAAGATAAGRAGATGMAPGNAAGIDPRSRFHAVGDGRHDDADALQEAINAGAAEGVAVHLPPGTYRITRPLVMPSNGVLLGSAHGLGFGCRIEPDGVPAFVFGGAHQVFHCVIGNLLVWPRGVAPDCIISVDNCYSLRFTNLRIHETQAGVKRAAIVLVGHVADGGHGPSTNILWENVVVRNDVAQPSVAILAGRDCGSHRFFAPDLENFRTLLAWRGGQIDLVTPYMERAGAFAVDCDVDIADAGARLNTFGGQVDAAPSGVACAIRATTRAMSSNGTAWGRRSGSGPHVYARPAGAVVFNEAVPVGASQGSFTGVAGWRQFIHMPALAIRQLVDLDLAVPAGATVRRVLPLAVAAPAALRASPLGDSAGLSFAAFVGDDSQAVLAVTNPGGEARAYRGSVLVESIPV